MIAFEKIEEYMVLIDKSVEMNNELEDEFLRLKYSKKELKEAFDLKPGEVQIESTLQKAYEIFEYQNRILK